MFGHSSFYELSVPFQWRPWCLLLGFNSHGYFLLICTCTGFCCSVLCGLLNDSLLLVITVIVRTALFKLSLLVAFLLISILIDCSFQSCCPCSHCFSHRYSAMLCFNFCRRSRVWIPEALESKVLFDSCNRPSRDLRLAPSLPLIVRKGTERGSSVLSVWTSRGFAILDLLLPVFLWFQ